MRACCRSVLFFSLCCHPAFGQNLALGFQFPATVKPGDLLTVTGTYLGGITAVTLKAAGKADLPATGVRATATNLTFTVPLAANGSYSVALSPGMAAPIPLTVTPAPVPPTPAASGPGAATTPPASGSTGAPGPVPGVAAANGSELVPVVYMPDGQLKSHSIRVYVTKDIQPGQNPKLRLLRSHAVTKADVDEAKPEEPGVVAPGQEWMQTIEGQLVRRSGTLLLFDLSQIDFGLKPMLRVMPVVSWTDGGVNRVTVGSREINIGNIVSAICVTVLFVALAVGVIVALSWWGKGNPILLLTGVDGHLSLAQTQIACWTVVVGGVVLGYGLIRLDIPDIPASLLVLMGASLATGGIGFFQDAQKQQAAVNAGVAPVQRVLALGDLIRIFPPGQAAAELSLAKAQMVFWTMLLLVLFIAKSILVGNPGQAERHSGMKPNTIPG